jgi:hypothetical protein
MDKQDILRLCRDCAASIYGTAPPSPQYAERVAKLLFMTAAHESLAFRFRRQIGFRRETCTGAFGLWQCEWQSIADSIRYVRTPKRVELYNRCVTWLDGYDKYFPELAVDEVSKNGILAVIQDSRGDPLSCLLARLHYLRVPEAVPATVQDMAAYAKRYYNTRLGKATAADYLSAYEKWWK